MYAQFEFGIAGCLLMSSSVKCPFFCPLGFAQMAVLITVDYQVEMRPDCSYHSVQYEYNLSLNKVKYRHSF